MTLSSWYGNQLPANGMYVFTVYFSIFTQHISSMGKYCSVLPFHLCAVYHQVLIVVFINAVLSSHKSALIQLDHSK